MKIPSKLDLILWGACALCVIGLIAVVNHWRLDSARLKVERTERAIERKEHADQVSALEERNAIEIENRRFADERSNRFQGRIRELEDQRTADGFGAIRVCRRPVFQVPTATAGRTAGGSDAASLPDDAGAAEVSTDVGPAAELYGTRCEANAIKLDELQEWVRGRR